MYILIHAGKTYGYSVSDCIYLSKQLLTKSAFTYTSRKFVSSGIDTDFSGTQFTVYTNECDFFPFLLVGFLRLPLGHGFSFIFCFSLSVSNSIPNWFISKRIDRTELILETIKLNARFHLIVTPLWFTYILANLMNVCFWI